MKKSLEDKSKLPTKTKFAIGAMCQYLLIILQGALGKAFKNLHKLQRKLSYRSSWIQPPNNNKIGIISVKIRQVHSEKQAHTYAVLACYSQEKFINTDLWKKLKASGIKPTIKIKILNRDNGQEFEVISSFKISKFIGKTVWIDLPVTYTKKRFVIRRWRCCNTKQNHRIEILEENCWRNYPDIEY